MSEYDKMKNTSYFDILCSTCPPRLARMAGVGRSGEAGGYSIFKRAIRYFPTLYWDNSLNNLVQRILNNPLRSVLHQLRNEIAHNFGFDHDFHREPA